MTKKNKRRSMTFIYSLHVFLFILTSFAITGLCTALVLRLGMLTGKNMPGPFIILFVFVLISLGFGVVITVIGSKLPLSPFRKLISAINELASGNFDVRINLEGRFYPYEIEELTASFNNMAKELGSIEMLRADFVNNFSHEFKTPIVSIRGFAKLLKKENLPLEEREEYLDTIIQESDRLAVLATNILNLSKIENQTIVTENEEFDLTEQIRRVILLFDSRWAAKDLDLSVELDEVRYYGNADLIGQIWVNVIDNAIKFSEPGGRIKILLTDSLHYITLKVRDYGCGMDEQTKQHVFDRFYQGDTSHATEGHGLGMAIVHRILDLYQGHIAFDSPQDEGTLVTIMLPKEKEKQYNKGEPGRFNA